MQTITERIIHKLEKALEPEHLVLKDQSHLHEGHAGHQPGGETHFRLEIVSAHFAGKARPECHRMIYSILDDELKDRVHALSIKVSSS